MSRGSGSSGQTDDALGRRLDSALRDGLGADRVDVGALLSGTRRRARTVRNQRVAAAVAAAAVVLAVPVGYEVFDPQPGVSAPPAVMIPGTPGRPTPPGPLSPPSIAAAVPATARPAVPDRAGSRTPVAIPDRMAFRAGQLPAGLALATSAEGPQFALSGGLACAPAARGDAAGLPLPEGARTWSWTGADEVEVDLVVSQWTGTDAAKAVTYAVGPTGTCRWVPPTDSSGRPLRLGDEAWTSTSTVGSDAYGRVVVRNGDMVAALQVHHPGGTRKALDLAVQLARTEVTNLG